MSDREPRQRTDEEDARLDRLVDQGSSYYLAEQQLDLQDTFPGITPSPERQRLIGRGTLRSTHPHAMKDEIYRRDEELIGSRTGEYPDYFDPPTRLSAEQLEINRRGMAAVRAAMQAQENA